MILMFDTKVAKICGANSAVILQNLYYWVKKNEANEKHFHDGFYWTYNSMKAFEELFDYMSKNQIRTAIDKLVDIGLVIKGNYNNDPFDKTAWYALTDKAFNLLEPGDSICEKSHTRERNEPPRCEENHTCINNNIYIHSDPDNKQTDINTDNNILCPEPDEPAAEPEPPVITLPLNTGEEYPITKSEVAEYEELYPAVDVMQQLRNMRGWLLKNRKRRKTKSGINRFVNSWLCREQDRGGTKPTQRSELEAWANG